MEQESVPPTWFSLYGLRWWEAQTARMTIMISRAPQDARMAIRVLLSVGFFKWKTQQENYFFSHCSARLCGIETSNTASVYLYLYINPYLGDFFIILGCQAGFHCKINFNQFACRWLIENSVDLWVNQTNCTFLKGGLCFTFAIYLHAVKLYLAIAVPPYQGAVSIIQICHQSPAQLRQIFLLLFLEVKWHICKHLFT